VVELACVAVEGLAKVAPGRGQFAARVFCRGGELATFGMRVEGGLVGVVGERGANPRLVVEPSPLSMSA
jgi:hypothetical protein